MPIDPIISFMDESGGIITWTHIEIFWDDDKVKEYVEEHPIPPNPYFESIDEIKEEAETSTAYVYFNPDYVSREFVSWFTQLIKLLKEG